MRQNLPMGQHGFARDMEFALEAQEGKEHLVCALIHRGDLCKISVPVPAAHWIHAG